jgi:hypothetical protein
VACEANAHKCSNNTISLELLEDISRALIVANETLRTYQLRSFFTYQSSKYSTQSSKEVKIVTTVTPTTLSWVLLTGNSKGVNWRSPVLTDTIFALQSPQPFLHTQCSERQSLRDEIIYSVDKTEKLLINPLELYERLLLSNESSQNIKTYTAPILWTPAVDDPYTLVALAPDDVELESINSSIWRICTVNAFWRRAKTTLSGNGVAELRPEMPRYVQNIPSKNLQPIRISYTLLNVSLLNYMGFDDFNEERLGFLIANAIASIPDNKSYSPQNLQGFDLSQLEGQSDITPFRIDTVNYGFGFGTRDIPSNLSVTAITVYCLIVVFYIGYIIITGQTSIAWNSPTELILLALQSKEPSDLGHVSVGVDSMETLRKSVGIRVSTVNIQGTGETREKLELVFEHDEETEKRELTKVVRNRAY